MISYSMSKIQTIKNNFYKCYIRTLCITISILYNIFKIVPRFKDTYMLKTFEVDTFLGIPVLELWVNFNKPNVSPLYLFEDALVKDKWFTSYLKRVSKISNNYNEYLKDENQSLNRFIILIFYIYFFSYSAQCFNNRIFIIRPISFVNDYRKLKSTNYSNDVFYLVDFIKALNSQKSVIEQLLKINK